MDKELLMALQYDLPLTEKPFLDLADSLGKSPYYVMNTIKRLKREGVIKRVGVNLNYKAFGRIRKAVLVAFACDNVEEVARVINESIDTISLKHNYLRDHPRYKVWFTFKGRNVEELRKKVEEIAERCGIRDYLFLPSKRVYKMDVKYDLYRGISWSTKGLEREDVPNVEELGIKPKMLFELERRLEIEERPFKRIAEKYGYRETELVALVEELIEKGVARDFSGVLRERMVGFMENGMNVVRIDDGSGEIRKLARRLVEEFPEITHLVEREVPEKWPYPLYFMVHADSRDKIENVRRRVEERIGVEVRTFYSIKNLNPNL